MKKLESYLLNSGNIFLFDAFGALLSLGSLLMPYYLIDYFGMPQNNTAYFIFIALFCFVFSIIIHFLKVQNWQAFLKIIASINFIYALIIIFNLIFYFNLLTHLGVFYFTTDALIVLTVSVFEFNFSRKISS